MKSHWTHIRDDATSIAEHVTTYCGRYDGSSVSEFHMREVATGRIAPWSSRSVTICTECCELAGISFGGQHDNNH